VGILCTACHFARNGWKFSSRIVFNNELFHIVEPLLFRGGYWLCGRWSLHHIKRFVIINGLYIFGCSGWDLLHHYLKRYKLRFKQ